MMIGCCWAGIATMQARGPQLQTRLLPTPPQQTQSLQAHIQHKLPPEGAAFLKAAPVWPVGMETEKNLTVHFRTIFVRGDEKEVTLFITASSAYRAYVNGEFLAHGPCVAAHGFYRLDQYAFAHLLKPGENIVSIIVAGYNTPSFYLLDQPAFLQAEIVADGKLIAATGQGDFTASVSEQRKREVPLYSHARPFTEFYTLDSRHSDWQVDVNAVFPTKPLGITAEKRIIGRGVHYPDYSVIRSVGNIGDTIYRFPYNATGFFGFSVEVSEPTELIVYFDELLKDEEGHIDFLETQLELLGKIGEERYGLLNAASADEAE